MEDFGVDVSTLKSDHTLTLKTTDTLKAAMEGLTGAHILSAPVYDSTMQMFVGFIDLADMVVFIHTTVLEASIIEGVERALLSTQAHTVKDVMQKSVHNRWLPTQNNVSVLNTAYTMATTGIRRVPIVNRMAELLGIVSQSDIVNMMCRLIAANPKVTEWSKTEVKDLQFITTAVEQVLETEPALKGFNLMANKEVSGVAVMRAAEPERLAGNCSLSDLSHITFDLTMVDKALLPMSEFLGDMKSPIAVTPSNSIGDVVNLISTHSIHRVYVVESMESMKLAGLLSCRDLLANMLALVGKV